MNAFEKDLSYLNEKIKEKQFVKNQLTKRKNELDSQFVDVNFLVHENNKKINKFNSIKKEIKQANKKIKKTKETRIFLSILTVILFFAFKPFSIVSTLLSLLGVTFIGVCNTRITKNKEVVNDYFSNSKINKELTQLSEKKEMINLRLQMIKEDMRKCNLDLENVEIDITNLNISYNEVLAIYENVLEALSVGKNIDLRKDEINLEHSKSLQLIMDKVDSNKVFKK